MHSTTTKAPTLITIPAGTRPTHCKAAAMGGTCSQLIYFVESRRGHMTPIDADVEGGKRPSESKDTGQLDMLTGGESAVYDGAGVSHFTTCPDADLFSRGSR